MRSSALNVWLTIFIVISATIQTIFIINRYGKAKNNISGSRRQL